MPPAAGEGAAGRASAPLGMNAQAILVCAFIASVQMTWGVIVPALPLLVERFGIGVGSIGLLIAAFAIGRVLANVPAGLALRRIPPRPFLQVVSVLLAGLTAVTGLLDSEPLLLGARLLAGVLGGAAVTIGFAVLVAGAPPARRGSTMATATVVQMSGSAVGALLGGVVVEGWGVTAAFAVAAVPLLLCLGFDLLRPARHYWGAFRRSPEVPEPETVPVPELEPEPEPEPEPSPVPDLAPMLPPHGASTSPAAADPSDPAGAARSGGRRLVVGLVVFSFATFLARFAGEQGLIPVLAYATGGLSPLGLGVAMAVGTVVSIAVLPVMGRLVDRGARLAVLVPAGVVGAAVLLAFPFLTAPLGFGTAIVLYYLATSVAGVVPNVVTSERFAPATAGAVVGLTRTAGDVGAAVGPLLVFALAAASGDLAAVAVIAAVLLVALAVLAPSLRPGRKGAIG
ncbi:MFS transporter [Herbiconiux sp. YIM B11900]|uniref:MFS transporter n=1 Tax=Herbiconiux sp. YIM B11900 TaxID=3404131 RepID=UPI003F8510A9